MQNLFRKNRKGFTLVEIVVVIAIIGILSMIVTVSVIAVQRNSEKKSAKSALSSYWTLTEQTLNQVNLGFSTYRTPSAVLIASRIGLQTSQLTVSTGECTGLSGQKIVHIQYSDDPTSAKNRYKIVRIVIKYSGKYYYTDDGKNCYGPRDEME